MTPSEADKIFDEFQRRAERGARDGIAYRFRLACVGLSPTLRPVATAARLLQARSGYTEAEKAGTRAELAAKVEAPKLETPTEFVEGVKFETEDNAFQTTQRSNTPVLCHRHNLGLQRS